jgi:hypothetical protein
MFFSLHVSPSGLHPCSVAQIPTGYGGVITHVTGLFGGLGEPSAPQQSELFVQMSPVTLQPLAGWQMLTCVGPNGAHARLQQLPPHLGSPASVTPASVALQSMPSTIPQLAGPPGGFRAHVPSTWLLTLLQRPVQQSLLFKHASPGWPQNDDG